MAVDAKLDLSLSRAYDEYVQMFNLGDDDLAKRIIGCGDGFSNFNWRLKEQGNRVVSCDPVYAHQSQADLRRFMADLPRDPGQTPSDNKSEESLLLSNLREAAVEEFLADYEAGRQEDRYLPYRLPNLPFQEQEFDLALTAYLLFTYSYLGQDFHYYAIKEMLRVAGEARIFPLVDFNCQKPRFLDAIIEEFADQSYEVKVVPVEYGFHGNDSEMLLIRHI